jgi:hypothetical protein
MGSAPEYPAARLSDVKVGHPPEGQSAPELSQFEWEFIVNGAAIVLVVVVFTWKWMCIPVTFPVLLDVPIWKPWGTSWATNPLQFFRWE